MKKSLLIFCLILINFSLHAQTLKEKFDTLMFDHKSPDSKMKKIAGHSHNDYAQKIPLLGAYFAGMESIEIDVYGKNNDLMIAHNIENIKKDFTLKNIYLEPIAKWFRENKGHAFSDTSKHLQLLIDIKENYQVVLPILIQQLKNYGTVFNPIENKNAIKIIISGSRPQPKDFKNYPKWIYFDGDVNWQYDAQSLAQTALISADLQEYTSWNGKGKPNHIPEIKKAIAKADSLGLKFRFYGNHDSPNTWIQLQNLGVYWINTDHPNELQNFIITNVKTSFQLPKAQKIYQPTFKFDEIDKPVKNIILLIGDGMGLAAIKVAAIANRGKLSVLNIKNIGLSNTESSDSDNTDSAAGGTAIATGEKTTNGTISLDIKGKPLKSLATLLAEKDWNTAILSIGDITDATPAVFYANEWSRDSSKAILNDFKNSKIKLIIGGKPSWIKENQALKGFENIQISQDKIQDFNKEKQIVFLSDTLIKPIYKGRPDILKKSIEDVIQHFSKQKKSFFMMAEAAQIDYAGHANNLEYSIGETLDFDKAIAAALKFADENQETLVLVTADHETGGISILDSDTQKGYVKVHFSTNDHTNDYVPVFAYGPRSYLFKGVYQNNELFNKIIESIKK